MLVANKPFSELIESSITTFRAQSWQWDVAPPFGSLVMARHNDRVFFGIVYDVHTGSGDASRTPYPYQKSMQELKAEQPHIFEFLQTTFSCLFVGMRLDAAIQYLLPMELLPIHTFVSLASDELAQQFFVSADFLHLLLGVHNGATHMDELLLAIVLYAQRNKYMYERELKQFLELYVILTGNEYRRVKLFASRVQGVI